MRNHKCPSETINLEGPQNYTFSSLLRFFSPAPLLPREFLLSSRASNRRSTKLLAESSRNGLSWSKIRKIHGILSCIEKHNTSNFFQVPFFSSATNTSYKHPTHHPNLHKLELLYNDFKKRCTIKMNKYIYRVRTHFYQQISMTFP